eukprot:114932-Alexandrium_andersonii.AAC.1
MCIRDRLPFPLAVRASLFSRIPGREIDGALGIQERRAEAARRCAARAAGAGDATDAAEDGCETE